MTTATLKSQLIFFICIHISGGSFIYHEKTNIIFRPEYPAEYFGFSALLYDNGLLISAPKAQSPEVSNMKPGAVFNCSVQNLEEKNVTCGILFSDIYSNRRGFDIYRRFSTLTLKDDMWFGWSMAMIPNGQKLWITAPRYTSPYGPKHLLMNGINYYRVIKGARSISPLVDSKYQAYVTNGKRKEYGEYGTHLNYYAFGQAGVSVAVTKKNTVIIGAPGLLQWTGGIISYGFHANDAISSYLQRPITPNPYYTTELGPDNYFGYSVDSGTFEKDGEVLYVGGAPRSNMARGKVLIFQPPTQELSSLNVRAKVESPQLGSYFGASICCTDINGDGLDDLLVGAPTFVKHDGGLTQPYDQGAVFVYMTEITDTGFSLEESGFVTGSEADGAWFGSAIADLGDIDGDGFRDIAIGAPWENNGRGAVYVYKGYSKGLQKDNVQRIQPEDAFGFGWSIAKGVDIDSNNCSDLAIGAVFSNTAYLYRCIPTMRVHPSIKVPNALNLPQNTTSFTAVFCVIAAEMKLWPHVELDLIGKIQVDPTMNRAKINGSSTYTIKASPGKEICNEQTIEVHPTADLSEPISIIFEIEANETMKENSTTFLMNAARISEDSTLKCSFLIQLVRDCGEDLICTPWLVMSLEALDNPYIPGSNTTLGARITILNKEEPAYGAKVNIVLPMPPKRIPSECSLQDLNMTCDLPAPLPRGEDIEWEIELDDNVMKIEDAALNVVAELIDPLYRNVSNTVVEELTIDVTPEADFRVSGKHMPNATIVVPRGSLTPGGKVSFKHYIEITNLGPSDWSALIVHINIPPKINLSAPMEGCTEKTDFYECVWSVPAMVSFPVSIPLYMDLNKEGDFMRENITYNATSCIKLHWKTNVTVFEMTTLLILEPQSIIWKIIVPCVFVGLLLLAIITRILYKRGFFERKRHDMLQQENDNEQRHLQLSPSGSTDNSNIYEELPPDSDSD